MIARNRGEPALNLRDIAKPRPHPSTTGIFAKWDREEGDAAKAVLDNKVRRFAGTHKRSRTLMRVAYLIIAADQEIAIGSGAVAAERAEFDRLCGLLDLDHTQVWPG